MKKIILIFMVLFISLVWTSIDAISNTNYRQDMGVSLTPSFCHNKDICTKIKTNIPICNKSKDPVYFEREEDYYVLDELLRDDNENDGKRMIVKLYDLAGDYSYLNKVKKETTTDYSYLFVLRNTDQQRK